MNTIHPTGQPFTPSFPIRGIEDIRRLEQTPLEQALTVRSTYEIFCNSARAFGSKTALTFLRTGDPADEPSAAALGAGHRGGEGRRRRRLPLVVRGREEAQRALVAGPDLPRAPGRGLNDRVSAGSHAHDGAP